MSKVTMVSRKAWHYRLYTLFGLWTDGCFGVSACHYWAAIILSPFRLALMIFMGAALVVASPIIGLMILWGKYCSGRHLRRPTCPFGRIEFEEPQHGNK